MKDHNHPRTAEGWWDLLEEFWSELSQLISKYHPFYNRRHNLPITAAKAEWACESARREIRSKTDEDPLKKAVRLKASKDPEMAILLDEVWFGMPESASVRHESGFAVLCDLCSEMDVLQKID